MKPETTPRHPSWWVPSLYFAEGLPYVMVMTVSTIMYKNLNISNTELALYTSWLYLPWVIKPFWSPLVDIFRTKRWWIVAMQFLIGVALAGVAFTIPTSFFFQVTLAFFWLMAFSSATHDIAADGFYMLALSEGDQSLYVGIRSTLYRAAMILGQGVFVYAAGKIAEANNNDFVMSWSLSFGAIAVIFLLFGAYHLWALPRPAIDVPTVNPEKGVVATFVETFVTFFSKPGMLVATLYLLFYRFAESQLVKMASPFLLDTPEKGGLGFLTSDVGLIYGTFGILGLTIGGIVGGIVAAKGGLRKWIIPMAAAINLPNIVYVLLAFFPTNNFFVVTAAVVIEQLGYGFGFTAYMLYMMYVSQGEHKTAHYAFGTGLMALGMMIPGMWSGKLQAILGYQHFFLWVMIATIPSFLLAWLIRGIPESYGKKENV
ncbi:MAG: MFS transporter [Bacteroidetes Order II. Incertae sedis bacterium]|nr:MFS transporter [Bacteroidetes Order II. bacterium]